MATFRTDKDPEIMKIAIALRHIKAITNNKLIRKSETHVAKIGFDLLHAFFEQKGTNLEAGGMSRRQVLSEIVQREAAIDDVLDDDDIATSEVDIEIFHDPHYATGLRCCAIGRHRHEVELDG